MSTEIDISKLDMAEVLAALFNASKQQGLGYLCRDGAGDMTLEQAREEIARRMEHNNGLNLYFDYLKGRVMKVNLGREVLDTWLYDRDNGPGAAERALQPLLKP